MSAMRVKTLFKKYLKDLSDVSLRGDAREESFYPTLAGLLQQVTEVTGRTHVHVATLPRPTEAGNPDFPLWNGTDRIIGCIEAKRPTEAGSHRRHGSAPVLPVHLSPSHIDRLPGIPPVSKRRTE
jgi:hypothetical protein